MADGRMLALPVELVRVGDEEVIVWLCEDAIIK